MLGTPRLASHLLSGLKPIPFFVAISLPWPCLPIPEAVKAGKELRSPFAVSSTYRFAQFEPMRKGAELLETNYSCGRRKPELSTWAFGRIDKFNQLNFSLINKDPRSFDFCNGLRRLRMRLHLTCC